MSFAEWLQGARATDTGCRQPYAPLYEVADDLQKEFGDSFDLNAIVSWLRDRFEVEAEARYNDALITAEANWRLDNFVISDPEAMESAAKVVTTKEPVAEIVVKDPPGIPSIAPLPCGFQGVDGNMCSRNAVLGAARCVAHGGMILDPDVRRSLMIAAHAKAMANQDFALETLLDVMETGRNDIARVQAAKELLDRTGFTVDGHAALSDTHDVLKADAKSKANIAMLRDRLDKTKDRLRIEAVPATSREA